MKTPANFRTYFAALMVATLVVFVNTAAFAEPATVLFEDQFNQGIPGWTAVHSSVGNFVDAPVLWQYDVDKQALGDNSNAYTDSATYSWSRIVDLLINDTVVSASNFTFKARILARDDDGCGLIWGYQNEGTYYRATFGRQNRVQWPYTGWNVD